MLFGTFLIAGIYFGSPKGFGVNEEGQKYAYNTMVYSVPEVIGCVLLFYAES